MLEYLSGSLEAKNPSGCVIEAGGLGYLVLISAATFDQLPAKGQRTKLLLHHTFNIERNTQRLFGFASEKERTVFRQLLEIQRIGPSLALKILGSGVDTLIGAIAGADVAALKRIKGVGAKVAERLVIELQEPLSKLGLLREANLGAGLAGASVGGVTTNDESDAVMALVNLGYKPAESEKAVLKAAKDLGPDVDISRLIREALGNV